MEKKLFKGFTLIEMLVVIVIIGILAAALVPRLQDTQARARDTQRKIDLKNIFNALGLYYLDNGSFPRPQNAGGTACAININCSRNSLGSKPRIVGLTGIMDNIPVDPVNEGTSAPWITGDNMYAYGYLYNSNVRTYDLVTHLENPTDPDRCEIKLYKFNNNASARCPSYPRRGDVYDVSPNVSNQ